MYSVPESELREACNDAKPSVNATAEMQGARVENSITVSTKADNVLMNFFIVSLTRRCGLSPYFIFEKAYKDDISIPLYYNI